MIIPLPRRGAESVPGDLYVGAGETRIHRYTVRSRRRRVEVYE